MNNVGITDTISLTSKLQVWRRRYSTGMENLASKLNKIGPQMGQIWDFLRSVECTETDLKKSHICPILGQFDPIWMSNLTSLIGRRYQTGS